MKKLFLQMIFFIILVLCFQLGCINVPQDEPIQSAHPIAVVLPTATMGLQPTATLAETAVPTTTPTVMATAVPTATPTPVTIVQEIIPLQFEHLLFPESPERIEEEIRSWMHDPMVSQQRPVEELVLSVSGGKPVLTGAEAEDDIRYLFSILRASYSGYGYFNQNGQFDRAQVQLLAWVEDQTMVDRLSLIQEFVSRLAFIHDCHFSITIDSANSFRLCQHQTYRYWDGMDFIEENGRFLTIHEGKLWELTAVNQQPPHEFLKLSLNAKGEPVYRLGMLSRERPDPFVMTLVSSGGELIEMSEGWKTAVYGVNTSIAYQLGESETGIPIVTSRTFGRHESDLEQFVADADSLRDHPILIIDIRGNGGGNDGWAHDWVTTYVQQEPQYPFVGAVLQTITVLQGKINIIDQYGLAEEWKVNFQTDLQKTIAGEIPQMWHFGVTDTEIGLLDASNLVIVLMDSGSASSAESFVGFLRQLPHVVFIGENTAGTGTFGEIMIFSLPHTGVQVVFGHKLFLQPDLAPFEEVGYQPDLWVPADKALDYALQAIEAGWIQPPE
ncbi:MAG: hypothetical protein GY943_22745 [Chloroflexi bacterium]|nr:hypothetical protein [Chloroflexota bacterium]